MESRPTQAVLPLVGLAAERIIRERLFLARRQGIKPNQAGVGPKGYLSESSERSQIAGYPGQRIA
ncbi:MAG: hypothetical protein ACQESR_00295 [Planctomycetota bacterium]